MTRISWRLVDMVSRMLEPAERDAVRGDFAESGETGGQALLGLLGLVVRRQAALWKDWRPWLALVGLIIPLGILLSFVSRRVADGSAIPIWLYVNNWDWAYLGNAGFRLDSIRDAAAVFMEYLTLICWSWTSGFVLAALSRRTLPVSGALFCFVLLFRALLGAPQYHYPWHTAVFSLTFYNVMFPLIVQTILVLPVSLWGMTRGLRLAKFPLLLQTILWAVIVISVLGAIQTWLRWWPFASSWQMRLLRLVVYWPVGYMIATAIGRRWHGESVSV
jgi:hypothetical protein